MTQIIIVGLRAVTVIRLCGHVTCVTRCVTRTHTDTHTHTHTHLGLYDNIRSAVTQFVISTVNSENAIDFSDI